MPKVMGGAPSVTFAKGGSTKMFGLQHASQVEPGQTAHEVKGNGKWAEGGKTKMFGKGHAGAAEKGVTAKHGQ